MSQQEEVSKEVQTVLFNIQGFTSSSLQLLYKPRLISSEEQIYLDILEYIKNGQVHAFGVKVRNIVRIIRDGAIDFEHDHTLKKSKPFRMMLWHGTTKDKIAPILTDGFKLPAPKGQMFGPGIYFADRISKSCNYCGNTSLGSTAYLFLCDVLLGRTYNAKNAHNELTKAPTGFQKEFDSVKCTGEFVPDRNANRKLKGSIIPCGPTIPNTKFKEYSLGYNEYIVYDTSKIRIKYLVEVEFTTK